MRFEILDFLLQIQTHNFWSGAIIQSKI
ncbi:hypothetical protein SBDP1_1500002 [Syntrophobacter sp. SbD1]|nr:hypothetical protein SBDP1_1500002 [Syntrophobacter sp. SbD1]